jgi:hypothetical protein
MGVHEIGQVLRYSPKNDSDQIPSGPVQEMRRVSALLLFFLVEALGALVADGAKASLRLTAARTNRGFLASPDERAQVASLAIQLEALNTEQAPTASAQLLGRWYLDYTDAADVLSLSLGPADIGDVYQEICSDGDGGRFLAQNAVELLPRGSSVLASFGVRLASLYCVEAVCKAFSPTKLSLLFVGGRAQALAAPVALPALGASLPKPLVEWLQDLVGEAVYLETTYLDEDMRVARGPGQELYILSKRDERTSGP